MNCIAQENICISMCSEIGDVLITEIFTFSRRNLYFSRKSNIISKGKGERYDII